MQSCASALHWRWIKFAHVCVCVLFFFFISSQLNVFTPKSRDLGSALYVRGIACYTSLSGLVQVL